eukprot:3079939-Rhodomonas_salina.1
MSQSQYLVLAGAGPHEEKTLRLSGWAAANSRIPLDSWRWGHTCTRVHRVPGQVWQTCIRVIESSMTSSISVNFSKLQEKEAGRPPPFRVSTFSSSDQPCCGLLSPTGTTSTSTTIEALPVNRVTRGRADRRETARTTTKNNNNKIMYVQ